MLVRQVLWMVVQESCWGTGRWLEQRMCKYLQTLRKNTGKNNWLSKFYDQLPHQKFIFLIIYISVPYRFIKGLGIHLILAWRYSLNDFFNVITWHYILYSVSVIFHYNRTYFHVLDVQFSFESWNVHGITIQDQIVIMRWDCVLVVMDVLLPTFTLLFSGTSLGVCRQWLVILLLWVDSEEVRPENFTIFHLHCTCNCMYHDHSDCWVA